MDRAAIAATIPHGAGMCMLDQLLQWDSQSIVCVSSAHHRPENPLLQRGSLHTACLVEWCAQAAALHTSLQGEGAALGGLAYLGSIKQLQLLQRFVADDSEQLHIEARCEASQAAGAIYGITARDGENILIQGRIVLVVAN